MILYTSEFILLSDIISITFVSLDLVSLPLYHELILCDAPIPALWWLLVLIRINTV